MISPDAFCGRIINDLDLWHLSIVALSELPFIMHCRPGQERGQEDLSATIDMYMKKDKFPWIYGRSFRLPSTEEFAFIRILASLLSQFAPNASRILRLRFLNWTFNLIYSDYTGTWKGLLARFQNSLWGAIKRSEIWSADEKSNRLAWLGKNLWSHVSLPDRSSIKKSVQGIIAQVWVDDSRILPDASLLPYPEIRDSVLQFFFPIPQPDVSTETQKQYDAIRWLKMIINEMPETNRA